MRNTSNGRNALRPIPLAAALALTVAGFAAIASAARSNEHEYNEPLTITVPLGDLNLATQRGQQTAKSRINRAADAVCGRPGSRDLRMLADYRNCVSNATSRALAQLRLPRS